MAIRAWLKVPCNKAGGSKALGRDSAFPHLLCKNGKPPEAGKIHTAEALQQSLCIRAQLSRGWRDFPSLCPACGAPKAALHHHPHGIHHTTPLPASQPWPAAVGTPRISLSPVGLLSHPAAPTCYFSLQRGPPGLSSQASLGLPVSPGSCLPSAKPPVCKSRPRYTRNASNVCQRIPMLKLTAELVRPTRQLGRDKQRA